MTKQLHQALPALLAIGALSLTLTVSGCSFSYSSESSSGSSEGSSESSSSPFESSSDSSGGDEASAAYQQDVADYTSSYVSSGSDDLSAFQSGVGTIAARYGIADWEAQRTTFTAVGKGLGRSQLSRSQYLTFKSAFTAANPIKMSEIQKGFESAQR